MKPTPAMRGVPEAQQDKVLKRYPLRRRRIPIGPATISMVVPDERAVRKQGAWASGVLRGGEPPYWVRIWPASVALARVVSRAASLQGIDAVDLGCGLGLPGIAAAGNGANVAFVDLEPDALRFAVWNAEAQPGCRQPPETLKLDWARALLPSQFDLMLLSDVSYHPTHTKSLRRQIDAALRPGGVLLHTDPERECSTRFLDSLTPDFVQRSWIRKTVAPEHRADVRVTVLARSEEDLATWWLQRLQLGSEESMFAASIANPSIGDPSKAAPSPAVSSRAVSSRAVSSRAVSPPAAPSAAAPSPAATRAPASPPQTPPTP
ncbi:MAG: methyltransferase [Planctomycetota bacterium]